MYNTTINLTPIALQILISLLFFCQKPITIKTASATAGLFCVTVNPLIKDKQKFLTCFGQLLTSNSNTAFMKTGFNFNITLLLVLCSYSIYIVTFSVF